MLKLAKLPVTSSVTVFYQPSKLWCVFPVITVGASNAGRLVGLESAHGANRRKASNCPRDKLSARLLSRPGT